MRKYLEYYNEFLFICVVLKFEFDLLIVCGLEVVFVYIRNLLILLN